MTDQNPKAFFPKLQSMARLTTHQLSLIEDKAYKRSNTTDNIEKACQQINSILVQESSMMETLQASITKVTSTFQNSDTVMSAGKRLLDHLTDDVNQLNKLLQTYGYQRPECDIDNSEHDHDAAVKNVVDVCAIYNNAGSAKENIAPDADSRDKSETLSDVDNAQLMALIMKYSKPICVHISAPPSSHISAPPSSHISAPPSSHISAPPSSHISALPSSHIPAPPSSHISAPPSSHNLARTCYTRTRLQYNAVSDSTEDEPKTPQHKDDSPFIDAVVITPGLYDGRLVPLTTPYHTGAYVDIISYEHLLPDQMQHAAPKAWEREARPSTPSMLCTPKYHYGSATFIAPSDDTNINSPLRPTFLTPALQRMMNKHYETPQQAGSNSLGQGDAGGDIGDGCVGSSLDDSLELPVFKTAAFRHLYSGKTNKTKSYTATTTLPVSTNIHTPRQVTDMCLCMRTNTANGRDALPASANNSMHNSHLSITTMSTVNTDLTVTVNRSVIGDISGIGTLDDSLELPTMRTQCFQELLDEMKAKRNQSQLESTTLANSTQAINDKTTNTAVTAAPASSKAAVATTADTVTVATTADTVTAATTVANTITTATIEADTTATAIATTSSNIITVHSNNKTMDTVFSDEGACDDNSAAMHNYEQESEDASSEKESKKSKSRKSFLGQPMEYISPVTELEYSQLPVYLKYASLKLINEAVALLNDVITFRMSEEGDSIVYDSDLDSLDSIKRPQERHTILYGLVQLQRIYRSSSDKTIFHLQ